MKTNSHHQAPAPWLLMSAVIALVSHWVGWALLVG